MTTHNSTSRLYKRGQCKIFWLGGVEGVLELIWQGCGGYIRPKNTPRKQKSSKMMIRYDMISTLTTATLIAWFVMSSQSGKQRHKQNIMMLTWWLRIQHYSARRLKPSAEPWPPSLPFASSLDSSGCGMGTTPVYKHTFKGCSYSNKPRQRARHKYICWHKSKPLQCKKPTERETGGKGSDLHI